MRQFSFTFHSDPGHAWLEVPRTLLNELGISAKISVYSYQNGNSVYLEEDQDAYLFMDAAKKAGWEIFIRELHKDNTPIRGYPRYQLAS